ncbi:MAG TPA: YbjQ family protein [bacterium]|nr:YbjQ family protein [bacterium]
MGDLIELAVFVMLILVGFTAGSTAEALHFKSLKKREEETSGLPVLTVRGGGAEDIRADRVFLVIGECVVAQDYFKRVLASLKTIFGGRLGSYETLVDRGRREAILRLKERAKRVGCDLILNMRIETSSIGINYKNNSLAGCVEVVAYGTAVILKK